MEKLIEFIENRYKMAVDWGADADIMRQQAFGAIEFYHWEHHNSFEEVERLWNEEWHPKFLALMGI